MTKEELYSIIAPFLKENGFDIVYSNHGWNEKCFKAIPPNKSANYLIHPDGNAIYVSCMCIFSPEKLIELKFDQSDIKDHMETLLNHECTPWPG